ncbi:MAG: nucleotidyl transferase AbiEii/AbiGii toxin family protein [bacterium]
MKDINRHRTILLNILKDVYQHPRLAAQLSFKGGTSLYFAYGLPRFSVDLDFSLLPEADFNPADMAKLLVKHFRIVDSYNKKNTWFWLGDYGARQWNLKVEISKRKFTDHYEVKDIFGLSANVMTLPDQFAHKLAAITDRPAIVNRDLFDAWWFFQQGTKISPDIIKQRTGQDVASYLQYLIDYIPAHLDKRGILNGLGELVDEDTKRWTKNDLLKELTFYLKAYKAN